MKTPRIPYNERVVSHVVVVTGKDKLKSNALPFTFVPSGDRVVYQKPSKSPAMEYISYSRLSPSYSPQPSTPSSVGCFPVEEDFPFFPSTPPANALEGILDLCAQRLDKTAEEEILQTAVLPADSTTLAVQDLDEKQLPTVVVGSDDLDKNEENILPPTILLPAAESILHGSAVSLDININLRN